MKEFFEEYGRVIVTVLVILGIILVGYVTAGNGRNSAFGKFTTDVVDSLSYQAGSLVKDSAEYIERSAHGKHTPATINSWGYGTAKIESKEKDGIISVKVNGKADLIWNSENTATTGAMDNTPVPWGEKSVMSFDFYCDHDCRLWINKNAYIEGVAGDDTYGKASDIFIDGVKTDEFLDVESGSWHHFIVVLRNNNESLNPNHKPFKSVCNSISYGQKDGTIHYQIKNLKYGIA